MGQPSTTGVGPRSWTLCGAVLLFILQLFQTSDALHHTEEGLELLFRERNQKFNKKFSIYSTNPKSNSNRENSANRLCKYVCIYRVYIFSSQSDWENVWHQETHSRCRDKLIRQLYWACEKDIYRLTRRNRKRTGNDEAWIKQSSSSSKRESSDDDPPAPVMYMCICKILSAGTPPSTWLHVNYANMFLRTRRSNAPSITNECCTKAGCTWEEYAEYCPSNKRRNHY
ncbi:probable insulin-like peptide 7 [Drosophila persimilis]|uniref:probable insulin-like peptide 7 n=1 Tax=Drosophila persimilis TaxID=7234 RepID=UPI000F086F6E|nr:probable insulin-like peptide 7 [Drosophila persimilis]